LQSGLLTNEEQIMNSKLWLGVVAALGLCGVSVSQGCAPVASDYEDEEAELGSVAQAFTATQCSRATAVASFQSGYFWESSTNYGTACNAVDEDGAGGLYLGYYSNVKSSSLPTNKADCENVTMRTVFYTQDADEWVIADDQSSQGEWVPKLFGGGMECTVLGGFFPPQGSGHPVRVATTVRRPLSSGFKTYPFSVTLVKKPS
jgi:hypothetical protein